MFSTWLGSIRKIRNMTICSKCTALMSLIRDLEFSLCHPSSVRSPASSFTASRRLPDSIGGVCREVPIYQWDHCCYLIVGHCVGIHLSLASAFLVMVVAVFSNPSFSFYSGLSSACVVGSSGDIVWTCRSLLSVASSVRWWWRAVLNKVSLAAVCV